jgi:hypothetical protein
MAMALGFFFELALGHGEFSIANGELDGALQVGVERIGRFDPADQVWIALGGADDWSIGAGELFGDHAQQARAGERFDLANAREHAGIVVLDGRRQVASQDFLCIMKEGQNNRLTGIDVAPEDVARDGAQGVSKQGDVKRVLRDVFGDGAAHQDPALD